MNLEEIYTEHKSLVFNLALQYVQNVQDAEEITQDVFIAAHKNLTNFKGDSSVKTWIYRITINKSLDHIKSKNRKKRWFLFSAKRIDDQQFEVSHFNHPGIQLEDKEALKQLLGYINQLPEKQKTVIILLKIEDRTQAEVADIMELSVKAVESLFQRAKRNLRQLLTQNEGK